MGEKSIRCFTYCMMYFFFPTVTYEVGTLFFVRQGVTYQHSRGVTLSPFDVYFFFLMCIR